MERSRTSGWWIVAPIPAVLIGIVAMQAADVAAAAWVQNAIAAGVGALVMTLVWLGVIRPCVTDRGRRWLALGCVGLLLLTLMSSGTDGVHRWISAGPVSLHISALVLPMLLVVLSGLESRWAATLAAITAAVLFLQPDAGQAWAFAVALMVVAVARPELWIRLASVMGLAGAAATLWRHDPLEPVPHVEGIVGLAAELGVAWKGAAILAVVLPSLVLLAARRRLMGVSVTVYLLVTLIAAWIGHFPVPFMGHGMAPILGYFLALVVMGVLVNSADECG